MRQATYNRYLLEARYTLLSRPAAIKLKRLKAPGNKTVSPGASVYQRRWLS